MGWTFGTHQTLESVTRLRFTSWMSTRLIHQPRRVSVEEVSQMPNKSPEPTAVGACSSAIAVHAASRRWLSFLR